MKDIFLVIADYLKVPFCSIVFIWIIWCFFKEVILSEIKKQSEYDLISKKAEINKEILSAIENQKADLQKELNKQMANFQVDGTRYFYLKKEEIDAYRIYYGKLLKTYHRFRNYVLHKNSIKVFDVEYGFIENHISKFDIPEQIKRRILKSILEYDPNAQTLFEKAIILQLRYSFDLVNKDLEEYFLENELFFFFF